MSKGKYESRLFLTRPALTKLDLGLTWMNRIRKWKMDSAITEKVFWFYSRIFLWRCLFFYTFYIFYISGLKTMVVKHTATTLLPDLIPVRRVTPASQWVPRGLTWTPRTRWSRSLSRGCSASSPPQSTARMRMTKGRAAAAAAAAALSAVAPPAPLPTREESLPLCAAPETSSPLL